MEDIIRVIISEPNKPAYIKMIRNDLKTWQNIVGGYVEEISYNGLTILCNEDGRMQNLEKNNLGIVGTFFVAKRKDSELVSIDESEINEIVEQLNKGVI